jgi:ATP-dependent Clp protease ATP-binding subunit ClpA
MKYNHNEEEVQKIKEQIVSLNKRIENSVIAQHYKEANRLKEEVSILEKKIQEKKRKFNIPREKRFKVTPLDIQKVLSIATGIPVTDLNPSDISKLKNLPKKLKKYIIGQDDAVKSIVSSIMRSKAGIASEARPV